MCLFFLETGWALCLFLDVFIFLYIFSQKFIFFFYLGGGGGRLGVGLNASF